MNALVITCVVGVLVNIGVIVMLMCLLRRDDETWWATHVKHRREDGLSVERTATWRTLVQRQRLVMFGVIGILVLLSLYEVGLAVWLLR